ncbi:MAG: hypothetical protein AB4058_17230 [Microcystaceae cyanobacterium]
MNNLDQQLQMLRDQAPNYGVPVQIMDQVILPSLKSVALQLQYAEYYFLTSLQQGWVVTTLSHRQLPDTEKRVIYAFANSKDASRSQELADSSLKVGSLPVTHLLFQLFALKDVDSLIFIEDSSNLQQGTEIQGEDLRKIIQQQLKRSQESDSSFYA